jgi:cell division septum initiation protein DivIVA
MTSVRDERAQMTSASEQVKERVQDAAQQAKGETREQLRSQVNTRSTQAGEQAGSIAEAMRRTSEQLRSEGKDSAAKVIDGVADRSERLGGYLTQADGDRILGDVEDFARRQPWVFVGGSAVLGFLAARFMKASSRNRYQRQAGAYDSPSRVGVPAAPASALGSGGGGSAGGAPRGGGSRGRE